jgi:hypothetical protein
VCVRMPVFVRVFLSVSDRASHWPGAAAQSQWTNRLSTRPRAGQGREGPLPPSRQPRAAGLRSPSCGEGKRRLTCLTHATHPCRELQRQPAATLQRPSEDVEDLINLLNGSPPLSVPLTASTSQLASAAALEEEKRQAERAAKEAADAEARRAKEAAEQARKAREAAEAAERDHKAREAEEAAERARKAKEAAEAAERERRAKEAAAAEALRLQRVQHGAALCIQSHWRGHCGRRQASLCRLERAEQHAAASVIQAAWRCRQVAQEHRARLVAAVTLQCAVRARRARRYLHQLRVEAFRRRRAARVILRALLAYRARYTLGPLRLPPGGRPLSSSCNVDGAALLAKQLRLRSAVDMRLAPECVVSSGGGAGEQGLVRRL